MILKIVGYAEQVAQYYKLEEFKAHIWIAHQRYPTKGRVWHPGGAHPFTGIDEALVHNGDFANYYSVTEYLKQRNVYPLFLTDTEVSVQVFDLLNRVYGYPLEYIIEALAPTTEMDFDHLPEEKQRIYRHIQATQIHGSPDGPWFFIIARTIPKGAQVPAYRHHRYGHAPAPGLRPSGRRISARPHLFREAGHRRDAPEPRLGGPAVRHDRRPLLEREGRQLHRRRRLHLHHLGSGRGPYDDLHRQVRQGDHDTRPQAGLRLQHRLRSGRPRRSLTRPIWKAACLFPRRFLSLFHSRHPHLDVRGDTEPPCLPCRARGRGEIAGPSLSSSSLAFSTAAIRRERKGDAPSSRW